MKKVAQKKSLEPMWKYVIFTYLLFWVMVLGICGTASLVFHASPLTMRILSNVTAWSPTLALLFMFKKLRPTQTIKEFYKDAFSGKLKVGLFILIPVVVCGAILMSVMILSVIEHRAFSSYFSLGIYSLPLSVILSLLSGPTGEESGWRGYLRVELNSKYGFLKGSLLLGLVWTFWHTVLWLVDSDFMDWRMLAYVLSNIIVMTSLSMIMNIILEKYNNLIYAIWIHFCFNLPYSFLQVDILYYITMSVVFPIIAILFWQMRKKKLVL